MNVTPIECTSSTVIRWGESWIRRFVLDFCLFVSGELHLSGEAATRFAEGLQITIAWVALVI